MNRIIVVGTLCLALFACTPNKRRPEPPAEPPESKAMPAQPKTEEEVEPRIKGEEVSYTAGDTTLEGFLAYDTTDPDAKRPGVLVVHEWWGHNEYTRTRARELAELGFTALAVDMYGDGKQADHPDDAQKFMMEVMNNMDEGVARFKAAMELLNQHPTVDPEKTAAIGYCFGGAVVLHMARTDMDLDAVAAFHAGALNTGIEMKKGDDTQILVAHGGADPFVKPEAIEAFKKEMDAAEADYELVIYEDAKHAFTNPDATENGKKFELPLEYNEEADEKSWEEMKELFAEAFPTEAADDPDDALDED